MPGTPPQALLSVHARPVRLGGIRTGPPREYHHRPGLPARRHPAPGLPKLVRTQSRLSLLPLTPQRARPNPGPAPRPHPGRLPGPRRAPTPGSHRRSGLLRPRRHGGPGPHRQRPLPGLRGVPPAERDRQESWRELEVFLGSADAAPAYAEVAARLGPGENTIAAAVRRMRAEFRTLLRREVADPLASGAAVDEESRYRVRLAW